MDTLLNIAVWVLEHWQEVLAYLGGGSAIALLVQGIKRKWKLDERLQVWLIDAKKFIFLLPTVFSALFASADAIINNGTAIAQWLPQAAHVMPVLMLVALAVHRFSVSGTWKRIESFLTRVNAYKASQATPVSPTQSTPPPPTFAAQ